MSVLKTIRDLVDDLLERIKYNPYFAEALDHWQKAKQHWGKATGK